MSTKDQDTIQRCPHDEENPFAQISRSLIRDSSISPDCRWLLIYMLSMKDGWKIKIKQIWNHVKDHMGRDRVREIFNEACDAGYMRKEHVFGGYKYFISENPKFKKFLHRPENQGTENQGTDNQAPLRENIECKEEHKEKSNAASPLADFLLLNIRSVNPKFTKEVSPKWIADFQKLLKLRSEQDLRKIIEWVFDSSFWDSVVLSPGNLLKNLDKIEMQMNKKPSAKGASREWIDKLKERVKNHREISIGADSFCFSSGQSHIVIKFSDPGYQQQITGRLRKMGISVEGL
jgi:hypothetical protein